jgi:hypothetical protein
LQVSGFKCKCCNLYTYAATGDLDKGTAEMLLIYKLEKTKYQLFIKLRNPSNLKTYYRYAVKHNSSKFKPWTQRRAPPPGSKMGLLE